MSQIRVTSTRDDVEHRFDDSELIVGYSGGFDAEGGVTISIDVYRGTDLVGTIPVQRFEPEDVDGFHQS